MPEYVVFVGDGARMMRLTPEPLRLMLSLSGRGIGEGAWGGIRGPAADVFCGLYREGA